MTRSVLFRGDLYIACIVGSLDAGGKNAKKVQFAYEMIQFVDPTGLLCSYFTQYALI